MFLKVIACEIAFRELAFLASQSRQLVDLEFLSQGLHDHPQMGRAEVQKRIDALPPAKYDAILVGYGLCGNLITGLTTSHTPLVIPRAHDCITFFLGSKERYQQRLESRPGSYYYTSGWLECLRRRGEPMNPLTAQFLPTRGGLNFASQSAYADWVAKYGAEQAQYLLEVMGQWTSSYSHGVLIEFDFTKALQLRTQVEEICRQRGWCFEQVAGELSLLERWLDGHWDAESFQIIHPGQTVEPSYDSNVIRSRQCAGSETKTRQTPEEPERRTILNSTPKTFLPVGRSR